jgi:hypothetical protein
MAYVYPANIQYRGTCKLYNNLNIIDVTVKDSSGRVASKNLVRLVPWPTGNATSAVVLDTSTRTTKFALVRNIKYTYELI